MRGRCDPQLSMFAFVDLDARIPAHHPGVVVTQPRERLPHSRLFTMSSIA